MFNFLKSKGKSPSRVIIDERIKSELVSRLGIQRGMEPVDLLIGNIQNDGSEDIYEVYDIVPDRYLRMAGLIKTEGLEEKIRGKLLKIIEKNVKKAEYGRATTIGIKHSHLELEGPSKKGGDADLIYAYPRVLHLIYVYKSKRFYAYNGNCDIFSVRSGVLNPEEASLSIEFEDLPARGDIAELKERIIQNLVYFRDNLFF